MVNTQDYVNKNKEFITVEEVQQCKNLQDKRAIVTGEAYFEEFAEKKKADGTVIKAATILIVPVSHKTKDRLLRLNKIANENLSNELGTWETTDWIGAELQLGIAGTGFPYINPTVINLPKKNYNY